MAGHCVKTSAAGPPLRVSRIKLRRAADRAMKTGVLHALGVFQCDGPTDRHALSAAGSAWDPSSISTYFLQQAVRAMVRRSVS